MWTLRATPLTQNQTPQVDSFRHTVTRSHSLSLSVSLSLTLSHSLTLSLSHSLTLSLSHSLTLSLSLSLSLSHSDPRARPCWVLRAHAPALGVTACAHLFSVGECRDGHTKGSVHPHQAPSSLRERDRLSPARLQPLDAFASGSQGSPLLSCDTTQTDPACSSRDPADRTVGIHYGRTTSQLKQDQNLPEWVSVPSRFPADPGDWKSPVVPCHGRGPCQTRSLGKASRAS